MTVILVIVSLSEVDRSLSSSDGRPQLVESLNWQSTQTHYISLCLRLGWVPDYRNINYRRWININFKLN